MNWERCGNTPYYRKTGSSNTFYVNPFNYSQVLVGAERTGEWDGIATVVYKKAPRYDPWDAVKKGVSKTISPDHQQTVLRATHEWFMDHMKIREAGLPGTELLKLFKAAPKEAQALVLEGISALIVGYGKGIEALTVIAIEKNSSAYNDLADLREVFDYAKKFYISSSLNQAIDDALAHFGIYEC